MKGFKIAPSDYDDIHQVGSIGLLNAIRSFNPQKGSFSTLAWWCISREIVRELKKPKIGRELLDESSASYVTREAAWELLPDTLTPTETRIIELKAQGFKYGDIEGLLDLNEYSLKKNIRSFKRKIRNASR
jgi:RNA polymerase sigma factor (sigma-70 family)